MQCWSCQRPAEGLFCDGCGAIQPPARGRDCFAVLGLARRFALDPAELDSRYRELSRKLHPDRFARADARARRYSLEQSTELNQAYRTLREPLRRAEYLLGLAGAEVGDGVLPPVFLGEMLELRERLAEARETGDVARLATLRQEMDGRSAESMMRVASGLSGIEAGRHEAAGEVAAELAQLRYFRRVLEELGRGSEE